MHTIPYVDFHTHKNPGDRAVICIRNIFPGEPFAAFAGRNFYSVGLHPWHIKGEQENNESLRLVEAALELGHVIAVGEAGLDKRCTSDFNEQQRVFKAQVFIAEEYNYPLIVHCVKAYNEILKLRREMKPLMPWVFHGYNGSQELTRELLNEGFIFSFGKDLWLKRKRAMESFKSVPLNRLFLETDEMDIAIEELYQLAADIKGVELEELKNALWQNFDRIEKNISNEV